MILASEPPPRKHRRCWLAGFRDEVVVTHPLEYEEICQVGTDIRDEMSASGVCRPPALSDAQLNLFVWVLQ